MTLRSTWSYHDDDPPARRFPTVVALVAGWVEWDLLASGRRMID